MKGKYASRATRRHDEETAATMTALKAELSAERSAHRDDVEALKAEIRQLHSDALKRAQAMADKAIAARQAELEQALADEGLTRELMTTLATQKDKLIFNACRYLSMTKGVSPITALEMVWTWFTEVDCYGLPNLPDKRRRLLFAALGLPQTGWVAYQLGRLEPIANRRITRGNVRAGRPDAITLDRADEEGHPEIHKDYRKWRKQYEYVRFGGGLELVAADGTTTTIR